MSILVRRYATPEALGNEAGAQFCVAAADAVAARGRFCVVLPGGRTPAALYRVLRESPWTGVVPWGQCEFFFSDERCVPPDDAHSNYALAQRELFARVPVPPGQIHRAPVEAGAPQAVAAAWESELRASFDAGAAYPEFDLAVLGVGPDGHTASLFPDDAALDAGTRWVMPVAPRGSPRLARVTLTLPVLEHARAALFLAAGADKREVIDAIEANAAGTRAAYPAARVRPNGGAVWLYSAMSV